MFSIYSIFLYIILPFCIPAQNTIPRKHLNQLATHLVILQGVLTKDDV